MQVGEFAGVLRRALEVELLRQRAADPRLQMPRLLRHRGVRGDLRGEVQQVVDAALHRQEPLPAHRQRVEVRDAVKLVDPAGEPIEVLEDPALAGRIGRLHLHELLVERVRVVDRRPGGLGREEALPDGGEAVGVVEALDRPLERVAGIAAGGDVAGEDPVIADDAVDAHHAHQRHVDPGGAVAVDRHVDGEAIGEVVAADRQGPLAAPRGEGTAHGAAAVERAERPMGPR